MSCVLPDEYSAGLRDLPCCLYHDSLCSVTTKSYTHGDKFICCKGSRSVKQTSIRRLRMFWILPHHQMLRSSEYQSRVVISMSPYRISAPRFAFLTEICHGFPQSILVDWHLDKWGHDCILPRPLQFTVLRRILSSGMWRHVKVRQILYRPGKALRVPGG
jgi:hypothetical protein